MKLLHRFNAAIMKRVSAKALIAKIVWCIRGNGSWELQKKKKIVLLQVREKTGGSK